MSEALDMRATAALVGLSSERFRKVWHKWSRELNFPAPFRAPDVSRRGSYAWDREDVLAWKERRKRALGRLEEPANDDAPAPARGSREARKVSRERAELRQLMRRGRA